MSVAENSATSASMNVILEINGKVRDRVLIPEQGITVGRSWDNEVIVKDDYVDPKQVRLSVDENGLIVEDLDSTNGTEISGKRINGSGTLYRHGELIHIGDTALRLLKVEDDTSKTKKRSFWFNLIRTFKPLPLLLSLMVVTSLAHIFERWIYSTEIFSTADAVSVFFQTGLGVIAIAAFFSIFNKLFKGHSSFKEHLILVCLISIFSLILSYIVWLIRFNLQEPSTGEVFDIASGALTGALFIVGGLTYITQLSRLKVWVLALVCCVGFIYYENIDKFTKEDHEKWSEYSDTENVVLPPAYLLKKPVELDDYLESVDQLFDRLEDQN